MATSATEVFDLFLSLASDYRLDALFISSGSAVLGIYIEPWLLFSIDEFEDICDQSLIYNSGSQVFSVDLTQKNIDILAQIMVRFWLTKTVQDILQMNNSLQDHDYRTFSQAQNLREKKDYLNMKREEISQMLQDYAYKRNDWSAWKTQDFD